MRSWGKRIGANHSLAYLLLVFLALGPRGPFLGDLGLRFLRRPGRLSGGIGSSGGSAGETSGLEPGPQTTPLVLRRRDLRVASRRPALLLFELRFLRFI